MHPLQKTGRHHLWEREREPYISYATKGNQKDPIFPTIVLSKMKT